MRIALHALTAASLATFAVTPAAAETVALTFLLANDTYKVGTPSERGGFARLNAVVKAERATGSNVIYVHAGDLISPSLLSGLDKGEHGIALLNIAPPDIFTPGNHEYDFGQDVFLKRMGEAKFGVLAANLRGKDGQPLPGFRDTEMRNVGGLRVGIVGLTAEDSPVKSRPGEGLDFQSTFDTAVARASELRAQGADLVVAVAHAARPVDMRLYDSGVFDIILSGDDHDLALLYNGKSVLAESREEAEFVTAIDVTAEIAEKDGKRRVSWFPDFRIIDTATVTPDPQTQAAENSYNATLDSILDTQIGATTTALDSRRSSVRSQEAAIGNLIADAMREATNADAAIINGGGIRGNRQYPAGAPITRRDLLTELPFGNRTVKLEISGADLLAALENGVRNVEEEAGGFPQVSGIAFTADIAKPKGQRVSAVTIGGHSLDPHATYTLATLDFLATGGDGYTSLASAKPLLGTRDATLLVNDVTNYISAKKTISPTVEGRINIKM